MSSLTISAGVASLLGGADHHKDQIKFYLDGDLLQMSQQETFLRSHGFSVGRSNVYPGLYTEDDFKQALNLIWDHRVPGWWHYLDKYERYDICTTTEFKSALHIECEKQR